ncbi:MAG TPA: nuclear transport factor 2 family protein [Mycobacteriales bacterium]|jgi:steroid delta-isomerase-like uncharacterized protein|nr:nuclear transport factor 2 family protein [Mycobacteriales bacterium]
MTTPAWFERWVQVWPGHIAAGGPDGEEKARAILDMFHPEGVYEDVAGNVSWSGEEELRGMFAMSYGWCPTLLHTPLHTQTDGRLYAIEWRMDGRGGGEFAGFPAHDKPFSVRGVSTGEADADGRIVRHSDYWNLMDWMAQCGHVPPLGEL